MKKLILPTLTATLLIFSGCVQQPSTPEKPIIDPTLQKVSINGHIESMTTIAFEWKPLTDTRVKGYYVYRNNPEKKNSKFSRQATIETRFVTHYTDKNLKPSTTYVYRFSSYNAKMQESVMGKTYRVTTKPILESVSFFDSIGNLPRMAKLIWRPHDNPAVKGYILERQSIEKPEWIEVCTINNRLQAEYIDRNLDDNRVYKYRLRAITYEGIKSTPSSIVKIVTKPLPKKVSELKATTAKARQIIVSWAANKEKDISHYNVYRSNSGESSYNFYTKVNKNIFIDKINEDGKNYYYKVTAVDKDGLEGHKQEIPAHGSTIDKPETPTLIDVIAKDYSAILSWKNNDERTKTYIIIKTTKDSWISSTTQNITGITGTTYTVKDLKPDTQYKFQVIAVDANGVKSEPTQAADVLFSTPDR